MELKRTCDCPVLTMAVQVRYDANGGVVLEQIQPKLCSICGAPIVVVEPPTTEE